MKGRGVRVVNHDVNTTEVVDSGLDDGLTVLHRVVVGSSLATGLLDLLHNQIGGLRASTLPKEKSMCD